MDLPPILYKYRAWDLSDSDGHDYKIVTDHHVYFTSPQLFNDPFDCNIGFDFESMSNREIANYFRPRHGAVEADRILQNLEKNRELFLKGMEWGRQKLVKDTGVLCLSADPNNLLLWSHYADRHAGVCVGIDSLHLCQIEDKVHNHRKDIILDHLQVEYQKELPKLDPPLDDRDWFLQQYRFKSEVWSYEQECRFVMIGLNSLTPSDRIISLPPEAIREVILGCSIAREHENQIRQALEPLQRENREIKPLRAERSTNCFALNVVPA